MKVTVEKNGEQYTHLVGLGYYENEKVYYAAAFDQNKKQLGFLTFKTLKTAPDTVWLYRIYVNKECRGRAVGTALLTVLENFCVKNGKTQIMAEFNPLDDECEEQFRLSEDFYKKHGFLFEVEGLKLYVKKQVSSADKKYLSNKIDGYRELKLANSSEKEKIVENTLVM